MKETENAVTVVLCTSKETGRFLTIRRKQSGSCSREIAAKHSENATHFCASSSEQSIPALILQGPALETRVGR
jgi:hypothetical protein